MTSTHIAKQRQIGAIGTWARVIMGTLLLVYGLFFGLTGGKIVYISGHLESGISWSAVALGFLGYPAILVLLQWLRLRFDRTGLEATGPIATVINIMIFAFLIAISFVPAISFIGYAAFIFYGASMLMAAIRGYAGCEVLAVPNWLLQRDDQIGCLVLSPVDVWERNQVRPSSSS